MQKIILSSYDHIANQFYGGGGAVAIHQIARQLSNDFDVLVLTARYHGSPKNMYTLDGVKYHSIGPRVFHPQLSQLLFLFVLPAYMQKFEFDLWIESFVPPLSSLFLPLFTRKPVIGWAHLLSGESMTQKYKIPLFKIYENALLPKYSNIIALTSQSGDIIRQITSRPVVTIIGNGIDTKVRSGENNGRKNWLYMGRIDEAQKGIGLLIKSFENVCKVSDWNLTIAGSGSEVEIYKLKKLIMESKAKDRIQYIGKVAGKQKEQLFNQSGALILTSRYETQPLVILEAFAHALPVLVPDIPDLNWLGVDVVYKSKRTDEDFSKHMHHISTHKGERLLKVKQALAYSKQFDWEHISNQYKKLIKEII